MGRITTSPFAVPNAKRIRATHPFSFRSGEWADLLTIAPGGRDANGQNRDCFIVRFDDGVTDFWVCSDEAAGYEFEVS